MTPDGRTVVFGAADGTLQVVDVASGVLVRLLRGHRGWVKDVAITQDGRRVASAALDQTIRVWDCDTGGEVASLLGSSQRRVAISGDGRLVVSVPQDQTLSLWDPVSNDVRAVLNAPFVCCAIAADGKTVVAGDNVGGVHVFDWIDGAEGGAPGTLPLR